MIANNINNVKRSRTGFVSVLVSISLILMVILTADTVSACHYTVGTFESNYITPKSSFYKGEVVCGKGTLDINSLIKLRIRNPAGNEVFHSDESTYAVYCSYTLNDTAPIGVWNIQLGEYVSGCWKWSTSSGRISYFTVGSADFTLTININGSGSVLKNPDKTSYNYGEVVSLTSISESCWSFNLWSGDLSGSNNPETLIMNSNKAIISHFIENQYTLTVNVIGNGNVLKNPDQEFYTCGSVVELTAEPDEGFIFDHWNGDLEGSENLTSIIMDADKTVNAYFISSEIFYTLTIEIDGNGATIPDVGDHLYLAGSLVDLEAIANPGWSFITWTGDLNSNNGSESILMDGNKIVIAHFEQNQYTLTINIEGNGNVVKNPDQINYTYGTIVELNAIPCEGSIFDHWSGDLNGSINLEEINMTENKNITAHFILLTDNTAPPSNPSPYISTSHSNKPPVAKAGGPYYGFVNETITFDGSNSYDTDQSIASYFWDFGDGTTGSGKIVGHNYSAVGAYKVILTVKDAKGASSSDETSAIITEPNHPASNPNITGPTNGFVDETYEFTFVSTDEDGNQIKYTVDWGDGTSNESNFLPSGEAFIIKHKWSEVGNYAINVSADDGKVISTNNMTISIHEPKIPTIPQENNICLIFLALLGLLLLILFLLLSKSERDKKKNK